MSGDRPEQEPPPPAPLPAGLVLAGGLSRRMGGGDKALAMLAGRPMLAHVLDRIGTQARPLAINANGDPSRFAAFALPVIPDTMAGHPGPLAGILAGLDWCAALRPAPTHLLTVPADTPFLPPDLLARLSAAGEADVAAIASSQGRTHPVIGLWPVTVRDRLAAFLANPDNRSVMAFLGGCPHRTVDFAGPGGQDPFANVNTPDDLRRAERQIAAGE